MQPTTHYISDAPLTLADLDQIQQGHIRLQLTEKATQRIIECRNYLDQKIKHTQEPLYGINTGFGSLYNQHISSDQLDKLQENLVRSHACGTGAEVPQEIVRLMLFLKIHALSYGHSGVQLETVQRLIAMFNEAIYPVVYEVGSLGASGDLAPLAHLALPLIDEGEVHFQNETLSGAAVNKKMKWLPIQLKAKEGLALLNGTEFMNAYGIWCVLHAHRLMKLSNIIGALSLDAFDGRIEPFLPATHRIRPQKGQNEVAAFIYNMLQGSELIRQSKKHVQDPYSFRCIPQVHGATYATIDFATATFLTEANSVTDNPNIFPDDDVIISGGNFHGQPLALALDFLAIALAEAGSLSERRTFQLISGSRGLPYYLVALPGINSGLMIPQYTAAALVSQNKQWCTPASVDSIVSSNGQEDHVSMGANAATKLFHVVNNIYTILAIELLTAAQALHFRRPLKTSPHLEDFVNTFRQVVPFIEDDTVLYQHMKQAELFLKKTELPS